MWSVVSVSAPDLARTERGPAAVQHAEWVRLFLGRALAPARLVGQEHAPSAIEYLISGIEVSGSLPRDDAACIEAASAVATDFEGLRDVIAYHRDRIERCAQDPNNVPLEMFLTTYPMLMCVTVSDDPADWRVTDQGLCIVRWGLRGPRHRPLLQWSAQELQALQRRVIAAAGMPDVAPGEASYSRVAKSAWKVIKDDDEQQRMQRVGDRAKGTGGESKAASGKPAEANPSPVAARAAWMAWLETGLIVLPLTVVVLMLFINNQRHSEAVNKLNEEVARLRKESDGRMAVSETKTAELGTQQSLTAQAKDQNTELQRRLGESISARDQLNEELNQLKGDLRVASNDIKLQNLQLTTLTQELASALASRKASESPITASDDSKSLGTTRASGIAPKSETPPVSAPVGATPAPPKGSNSGSAATGSGGLGVGDATRGVIGGANTETSGGTAGNLATSADTTVAGQADPLGSLLRELSTLYRSTDATSKSEDFLQRLSVSVNGLNQTQVDALKLRGTSTNLECVRNYISGTSMPQLLLQRSAELDVKFGEALSKQVDEFLKNHALIKFQPIDTPVNKSTDIRWRWIRLGEVDGMAKVDKSLDALCKRLEKIEPTFVPTPGVPQVEPPKGTWYRVVDNLAAYPDGLNIARGVSGRMFADAKDGPFEKPQQVRVLVWPSRQELSGNTKPKLDDLIKLLSSIGNKAVLTRPRSDQNPQPISVDTPTFVAWEFAKSCLMTSSQYCSMVPVKGWLDQLVAILEKNENGAQMDYVKNMREFRQRLLRPPFFRAVPQNGFTTHFVGALSVSGGDIKIVKPVGAPDDKRTGDLAVVDGLQFRHIGELEDGKPVFDAHAELDGSLLGCAVFVVEPKQKYSPSK